MTASIEKPVMKKPGRPATGMNPMLSFRAPPEMHDRINGWADRLSIPRSEAIRRLVELGFKAEK
jgi:predicted DNA-binding protein